jgi:hypothetical protein
MPPADHGKEGHARTEKLENLRATRRDGEADHDRHAPPQHRAGERHGLSAAAAAARGFAVYLQGVLLFICKGFCCLFARGFAVYLQGVLLFICKGFCCLFD